MQNQRISTKLTAECSTLEPPGSFAFCDGCAAPSQARARGRLGTSLNLGQRMLPRRSLTLFLLGGNLSVLQELECRPTSWADSRFAGSRIIEDFNEVIGETILHRRGNWSPRTTPPARKVAKILKRLQSAPKILNAILCCNSFSAITSAQSCWLVLNRCNLGVGGHAGAVTQ